jgi:hypothetical protein
LGCVFVELTYHGLDRPVLRASALLNISFPFLPDLLLNLLTFNMFLVRLDKFFGLLLNLDTFGFFGEHFVRHVWDRYGEHNLDDE